MTRKTDSKKSARFFVPFSKVEPQEDGSVVVRGIATVEEIDKVGEVVTFEASKKAFAEMSEEVSKATDGLSLGNLRSMHQAIAAGKIRQWSANDATRSIEIEGLVVDPIEAKKAVERVYTGLSIGARDVVREVSTYDGKSVPAIVSYSLSEVSLVDRPACPGAVLLWKFETDESEAEEEEEEEPAEQAPEPEPEPAPVTEPEPESVSPGEDEAAEGEIALGEVRAEGIEEPLGFVFLGPGDAVRVAWRSPLHRSIVKLAADRLSVLSKKIEPEDVKGAAEATKPVSAAISAIRAALLAFLKGDSPVDPYVAEALARIHTDMYGIAAACGRDEEKIALPPDVEKKLADARAKATVAVSKDDSPELAKAIAEAVAVKLGAVVEAVKEAVAPLRDLPRPVGRRVEKKLGSSGSGTGPADDSIAALERAVATIERSLDEPTRRAVRLALAEQTIKATIPASR
jgi:hypothetical protein